MMLFLLYSLVLWLKTLNFKFLEYYTEKQLCWQTAISMAHFRFTQRNRQRRVMAPDGNRDSEYAIPNIVYSTLKNDLKNNDETNEGSELQKQSILKIFEKGIVDHESNYLNFFKYLLWLEESVVRQSMEKNDMNDVNLSLEIRKNTFCICVPGLADKKPAIITGDSVTVRPTGATYKYNGEIVGINRDDITIGGFEIREFIAEFHDKPRTRFFIRFLLSRLTFIRQHIAINSKESLQNWIYPKRNAISLASTSVTTFFNPCVGRNKEQRAAVESIVGGTAGAAPFLLHGPPGTGKTVTIVEAILQLVKRDSRNRILVCADSNTAADNVARGLIRYHDAANGKQSFLFRYNSDSRDRSKIPEELRFYCKRVFTTNSIYDKMETITVKLNEFKIIVTTLSNAAKLQQEKRDDKVSITHLFIDEAAQATEPATLIPMIMLGRSGRLVLAGDPLQLGPVTISQAAGSKGLGVSLMERLRDTCPLYSSSDPAYTMLLCKNFRSAAEILEIPNALFYKNKLTAHAASDPLSTKETMGKGKNSHAIEFYGLNSRDERSKNSPSYCNRKEVKMVIKIITALINKHKVKPTDIGVVTPYVNQVRLVKQSLRQFKFGAQIEVGSVEAYQGNEKRVIIISTVRSKQLGFLVDDKRFNVAMTRAKAKAIVIGNLAIMRDEKWKLFIKKCETYGTCYFGQNAKPHKFEDDLSEAFNLLAICIFLFDLMNHIIDFLFCF